eukprot:7123474-Pyramimonas_sp.AAC.1
MSHPQGPRSEWRDDNVTPAGPTGRAASLPLAVQISPNDQGCCCDSGRLWWACTRGALKYAKVR